MRAVICLSVATRRAKVALAAREHRQHPMGVQIVVGQRAAKGARDRERGHRSRERIGEQNGSISWRIHIFQKNDCPPLRDPWKTNLFCYAKYRPRQVAGFLQAGVLTAHITEPPLRFGV
jgi:hypothetical protein